MTRLIKQAMLLAATLLLLPIPVLAQDDAPADTASFVGSYTLWAAIIIGIAASLATLYNANQLRGGVVGTALNFFGAGMLLVVLGFLAVVVDWAEPDTQAVVHDLVFIAGYILMLMGAFRLRQLT